VLIVNATYLAPGGEWKTGHILCRDARLRLLDGPLPAVSDTRVFDAAGMRVLPGLIDSHTHFREPGQSYKEGIARGSTAALTGGVTTVLDMPNNSPPCTTLKRLELKRKLFERKCLVNWGLHLQASQSADLPDSARTASAKVYMAGSSTNQPICDAHALSRIFASYPVVTIHAEDETCFLNGPRCGHHHELRPIGAIRSALDKIRNALETLPAHVSPRIVLAHVSTAVEVDWLAAMKNEGFDVWGETCPHYFTFTQWDYLARGTGLKVNPPLRTEMDRIKVQDAVKNGPIDFLSSDHAPHTRREKAGPNPPSGIPGIEWMGPLALALAAAGEIDWRRFLELTCENAARCFSIPGRDGIREGNFADLILVVPAADHETDGDRVVTRAAYNPYRDHPFTTRVAATIVNGRLKRSNGRVIDRSTGSEVYQ